MGFRQDNENFPFSSKVAAVWYFVIDWKSKAEYEFTNVQSKRELVPFLFKIITDDAINSFSLFGVWNGQYKADIFKIDIEEGYSKLKEFFPEE
jgi:hypothetical protein